jgi:nitrous oxide reductase accessory protein NosL
MLWLALVSLLTIGCVAQARSPEPVPVDHAECARCRMLISSENGTAQILSASADTRFYDDVGCLASDWSRHADSDVAFVHLATGRWIDARQASYARPSGARTAMGSGFVAFATADEARAADADGRVFAFDDVVRGEGAAR